MVLFACTSARSAVVLGGCQSVVTFMMSGTLTSVSACASLGLASESLIYVWRLSLWGGLHGARHCGVSTSSDWSCSAFWPVLALMATPVDLTRRTLGRFCGFVILSAVRLAEIGKSTLLARGVLALQ